MFGPKGRIPEGFIDKILKYLVTTKGAGQGDRKVPFMSKAITEKNMNGALSVYNKGE